MAEFNHIAILAAMPEELGETIIFLKDVKESRFGDLIIYTGLFISKNNRKIKISLAWSGWGKVSASRAATRLISSGIYKEPVDLIIFTGVAGAINRSLKKWDFVIGKELIQYDLDASPLFDKYIIPALNTSILCCSRKLVEIGFSAAKETLINYPFLSNSVVKKGLIGTGDQFISDGNIIKNLEIQINGIDAVEMEGAAIAQVAVQENIPWLVTRVISDSANEDASQDFSDFLCKYKKVSGDFIKILLNQF